MYNVDEFDAIIELAEVPKQNSGSPCPIVIAEDWRLALSYWEIDDPPCQPTTAPLAVICFRRPYMHLFGPPNEDAISGHPLSGRGLYPGGAFRVDHSSLIRHLARMNSVRPEHSSKTFDFLSHFIFTFHDSTFECVAESIDFSSENVRLQEEHLRTLQLFRECPRGGKPWLK